MDETRGNVETDPVVGIVHGGTGVVWKRSCVDIGPHLMIGDTSHKLVNV